MGDSQEVASDGSFDAHIEGADPATAVASTGEQTIAWAAEPTTSNASIQVSTAPAGYSAVFGPPRSLSGLGEHARSPQLAYGLDGTLVATWAEDSGVWVAVRKPTSSWTVSQVSSTPNSGVDPQDELPAIAVTTTGDIVVAWYADEGQAAGGHRVYAVESTYRAPGEAWTTPTSISDIDPPAVTDAPPTLIADSDGSATAAWVGSNAGDLSRFNDTSWTTPAIVSSVSGSTVSLSPGPNGQVTAVWCHAADASGSQVRSSVYTPDQGWGAESIVNQIGDGDASTETEASATTDQNGTTTAWWVALHPKGYSAISYAQLAPGASTWTTPFAVPDPNGAVRYEVAADSHGYPLVVADNPAVNWTPQRPLYDLTAVGALWPEMTVVHPRSVTGVRAIGSTLTLHPETLRPRPSGISLGWVPQYPTPSVTGATYRVVARDAGGAFTTWVDADAPFHRSYEVDMTDVRIPATPHDFNRDGRADVAVYRPRTGMLYVRGERPARAERAATPLAADFHYNVAEPDATVQDGGSGTLEICSTVASSCDVYGRTGDIPVIAPWGYPIRRIVMFRPSDGDWFTQGMPAIHYGLRGDVPVAADYTGNGEADLAVYRPSTSTWYVRGEAPVHFGARGDIPLPGDYLRAGKADIAVYRPSTHFWFVRGQTPVHFGTAGDLPVPADYNGDGKVDIAVFRPSTHTWYVRGQAPIRFGITGDIPI